MPKGATVLLTGATGYIGGRLAPRLLEHGYRVRCLVRSRAKLVSRPWASDERVEIVEGDARDRGTLAEAMNGAAAAYFLIHSMDAVGREYRERDLEIATAFGEIAAKTGLGRIIYLGGLGEDRADLSEHLASRREVERALGAGGVPTTVLRAAMIIGSGSASFEILRYLVERLPIMITPRWVRTESQPISVRDVLFFLVAALETPATAGRVLDIGGPEIRSYADIMRTMAEALGLRRRIVIPVPVLTPHLSSLWIHVVTPLGASIARPLAEGLKNRVVCRDDEALRLMPRKCLTIREAIDAAIARIESGVVETAWSDAGTMPGDPHWAGGTVFVDRRELPCASDATAAWRAACSIGGANGYYAADWLWRLRGVMDRMIGGPGLRRRIVIPVPVLTPRLSSLWIHVVTPLGASIARPLAEGLKNRVVCRDDEALRLMPRKCLTIREAIDAAIARIESGAVETAWSDAGTMPGDPHWAGGTVFVDRRELPCHADPQATWRAACSIGGANGYYAADWLWRLRGVMDRMIGGPGLRRGRRSATDLRLGDALDFWRVTAVEPPRRLELTAEMLLPGVATLTLEVLPAEGEARHDGARCVVASTARFRPLGLLGILYWYSVLPLHGIVFRGMLKGIVRSAESGRDRSDSPDDSADPVAPGEPR